MIDYSQLQNRPVLCVDLKSYYASVEAVSRGLDPMRCLLAVVSDPSRPGAVVLAASPELKRRYGVKTAGRLFQIPRDPSILIVPPRMAFYLQRSVEIVQMLYDFVPPNQVRVYSVDEAWLDVSGVTHLLGPPRSIAEQIRERLLRQFGLPVCVGIGPNMLLAKVALDVEAKALGVAEWTYGDVPAKLWPLPTRAMWGIGSKMAAQIGALGIRTVGEIARSPLSLFERRFGVMGNQIWFHAHGVDESRVDEEVPVTEHSYGKGVTLMRDYRRRDEIRTVLLELVDGVTARCRAHGLVGRTAGLTVRYSHTAGGGGFSHARQMEQPTNLPMVFYRVILDLLAQYDSGAPVRQLYVSLGKLGPAEAVQANLFGQEDRQIKVMQAVDEIRNRFGATAILRARNLAAGRTDSDLKLGGHFAGTDWSPKEGA